jgi:hypothetical protein
MREALPVNYTTKDTVPLSSAFSPTMTTKGRKFSVSAANSGLVRGAVIYVAAQSLTRRIVEMTSTTTGKFDQAFTSDLAAATVRIVPKESAKLIKWSAVPPATKSLIYNGVTLLPDAFVNKETDPESQFIGNNYLQVPVIDGTVDNPTVIWVLF